MDHLVGEVRVSIGQPGRRASGTTHTMRRSGNVDLALFSQPLDGVSGAADAPDGAPHGVPWIPAGRGGVSITQLRDAVVAALADVAGTEPTPAQPSAPTRTPRPGLGPLSLLQEAVVRFGAAMRERGAPAEVTFSELTRLVSHALPSDTPDWCAHLLLEAIARWAAAVYTGSELGRDRP